MLNIRLLNIFATTAGNLWETMKGTHIFLTARIITAMIALLKHRLIDADEWLFAHGISIYDHAVYKNGEIIAYQKWGKSFRRDVVKMFDEQGNRI